jgi:hypothetical protein
LIWLSDFWDRSFSLISADQDSQLMNYMRLTRPPVGDPLNFGQKSGLEWKRFLISDSL